MEQVELKRLPKTRKGRKIMKMREPQIKEGPKSTLFVKGMKTSEPVSRVMSDLYRLKKMNSVQLGKRMDFKPFEAVGPFEALAAKNHSPFIVMASNSKKRPDCLLFSRFFDGLVLDMFELQMANLVEMTAGDLPVNCRPMLQFNGDLFEYDTNYQRIKNYFFDFFYENIEIPTLDISKEFSHLIQFTAQEEKIILRTYEVKLDTMGIQKKKTDLESCVTLVPISPCCDLLVKRQELANQERFKLACKTVKIYKNKENKNVTRDKLGHKVGKVYLNPEKMENLALKKRKKLIEHKKPEEKKTEKAEKKTEKEAIQEE